MKNFLLFFTLSSCFCVKAQDTLLLVNDTKLISLVLLVTPENIRYKAFNNISGPDQYINTKEVKEIRYRNGSREQIEKPIVDWKGPEKMYEEGRKHADLFYHYKAGWITLGSVFFTPITFIPVGQRMFKAPNDDKLYYPDEHLWKDENYQKGYKDRATAIRRKKMIGGFVGGSVISHFLAGLWMVTKAQNAMP